MYVHMYITSLYLFYDQPQSKCKYCIPICKKINKTLFRILKPKCPQNGVILFVVYSTALKYLSLHFFVHAGGLNDNIFIFFFMVISVKI